MTQQDDIGKAFFEEGLNVSQVAEKFNGDRKTVRKYIRKEDWKQVEIIKRAKFNRTFFASEFSLSCFKKG